MDTRIEGFPLDWNDWRDQWKKWKADHAKKLRPTAKAFPGRNLLADEILGTWIINGLTVELSEVTFPSFGRDPKTGRLLDNNVRGVGISRGDSNGTVVHSFAELETELGLNER